jgi:FdhE protein
MGSNLPVSDIAEQALVPEFPQRPTFAQRIQRAHDLAEAHPSASEILNFYARLAFHQQHVFDCLRDIGKHVSFSSHERLPLMTDVLLPHFPAFARSVAEIAPFPLGARATELARAGSAEHSQLLTSFWEKGLAEHEPLSAADRSMALAFLQPYAELLASLRERASPSSLGVCPICESQPVCGVLRDRGHGAGRTLVCSLCMTEWNFLRVVCPACGEDLFESLPVFTCDDVPQVRIDACDTCQHYLKTVDMTKDGLAVPVVDELAAVSLDLWAREHGYEKFTMNLVYV